MCRMTRKNAGNYSVHGVLPWHEAISNLHIALLKMKPMTYRSSSTLGIHTANCTSSYKYTLPLMDQRGCCYCGPKLLKHVMLPEF